MDDRLRLIPGDLVWCLHESLLYVVKVTEVKVICEGEKYEFAMYNVEGTKYSKFENVHASNLFKLPDEYDKLVEELEDIRERMKRYLDAAHEQLNGDEAEAEPDLWQIPLDAPDPPVYRKPDPLEPEVVNGIRLIDVGEHRPTYDEIVKAAEQKHAAKMLAFKEIVKEAERKRKDILAIKRAEWLERERERLKTVHEPDMGLM